MKSVQEKRRGDFDRRQKELNKWLNADIKATQKGLKCSPEEAEEFLNKKIARAEQDISNLERKLAYV